VAPHLGCHVSVDRVKIDLGAKTVTSAKLRGRFCNFFSYGIKIATLGKLGAKTTTKSIK